MLASGALEAEVTFTFVAFEGTKQIRRNSLSPFGSVAAHFAFCGQGRGGNRLQRDRNLGEDHSPNVQSHASGRGILVRLCQTW